VNRRGLFLAILFSLITYIVGKYTSLRYTRFLWEANMKDVYYSLKDKGVLYPRVYMAQRDLESNYGKSKIYRENNNGWGLKVPKYRKTYAIGENHGHAVYASIGASALDYIERQNYWKPIFERNYYEITCEDDYLTFLLRTGYAEDPKYVDKLRVIIKKRYNFLPDK